MNYGVVYVAYGETAHLEATESIKTLLEHNDYPVVSISQHPIPHAEHIEFQNSGWGARRAKLYCDQLVPQRWDRFLYIDADTRVRQSLHAGFEILEDGWDVAVTPSSMQGDDVLWHVSEEERKKTFDVVGVECVQIQGGLFFVNKNEATQAFFETWRREWEFYQGPDQAALLRALYQSPVRMWMLGRPWNGGVIVDHRYGTCRTESPGVYAD